MTRNEALELAVHIYGTSACCDLCTAECFFEDYKKARPAGEESDLAFGLWLLETGWRFDWREYGAGGGWDSRFLCPSCAAAR